MKPIRERTRAYSLLMGTINFGVTGCLFLLARINAAAGWPNLFVSVLAPLLTVLFLVFTIGWFIDALRPGELGDRLPRLRPGPGDGRTPAEGASWRERLKSLVAWSVRRERDDAKGQSA